MKRSEIKLAVGVTLVLACLFIHRKALFTNWYGNCNLLYNILTELGRPTYLHREAPLFSRFYPFKAEMVL